MIQVSHLTKMYGPRTAVNDLTFSVKRGEIVGFLGPNGAGKSTTMKILTGYMPATDGEVKVAGFDVFDDAESVKKNIGYLPEHPPLYLEMTVQDFLFFAGRLKQIDRSKLKTQVDWAIEKTNLGAVRNRIIGNLSKGYRQRVGLAQALVHNPPVLILDEPTVGLDPAQIIEIRELIKSLGGDHTVVLSSHILPEVTATCSRIIVINHGKIVAEDSMENLTMRLKKGLLVNLIVRTPSDTGISTIRAIPGVEAVNVTGSKIIVQLKPNQAELRDRIANAAVESGMGILEFGAERVSLEEVFLQLTTDENPAPGGAA